MSLLRLVLPLVLCSCATAADNDVQSDPMPDAKAVSSFADAAPHADARPLPDAARTPPADAATPSIDANTATGGGLCEENEDCPVSGECCFVLLCTPGSEIGNGCFPD